VPAAGLTLHRAGVTRRRRAARGRLRENRRSGRTRLAQLARRERAPAPAGDEDDTEPAWEDRLAAAETLEHALDGRAAVEVLTSLRRREARYLALLAAGYSYGEIAEREGVTYTKVI
jgi:DNA-directed RNA polymerase specialized sigma24 family protein